MPRYQLTEVFQLESHMRARIASIAQPLTDEDRDRRRDWIASRFTYPLRELMIKASRNGRGNLIVTILVVGGGFAVSGVAIAQGKTSSTSTSWWIFSIGLVVALAGGVNQLYRPGYRAKERLSLITQFEEEGWAFANASKPYEAGTRESLALFEDNLSSLLRRATEISAISEPTVSGHKPKSADR